MKKTTDIEIEAAPGLLHEEPGWVGHFTREQHPSAMRNGTRVIKQKSELHDAHPDGTFGTVLGSLKAPNFPYCGYFIEWDPRPKTAVFTVEWKLRKLS